MHFKKTIIKWKYETTLLFSIILYTIVFSHYTNLKNYAFSSFGWDLGIFNQIFYSSIYGGKFFQYTPDLFFNTNGNYFAIHFSPILILLFPLYAAFPKLQTLLVSKCFILSLAALPLFYASKKITESEKISLIISLSYLLHPGVQGANWFDFQPQIFLPLFIFTMFLTFIKGNWKGYLIMLFLTLSIEEHVFSIIIILLLSYLSYDGRRELLTSMTEKKFNKYNTTAITVAISAGYYYVSLNYINSFPIEPEFLDIYKASSVFDSLGFRGNTLLLPIYAISHLDRTLTALMHDLYLKFLYVLFLFAPLLFLPIMNRFFILNLIILSPFFLSNYRAYYMIGSHYSLYILPSIFISLIYTFKAEKGRIRVNMAQNILVVASLVILMLSPISPLSRHLNETNKVLWYPGAYEVTDRTHNMHRIINQIPRNATILTQNHLFPHISGRVNAYILPLEDLPPDRTEALRAYVDSMIEKCEYVLLDLTAFDSWTSYVNRKLTYDAGFGIHTFSDMAILFKRGAEGKQTITWETEHMIFYADTHMQLGFGDKVVDQTIEGRRVALSPAGSERGFFLYGPYAYILDGVYKATLYVKATKHGEGYLGTVEVTSAQGAELITKLDLYGYEFPYDGWRRLTITLSLVRPRGLVEFRFYTVGAADILVDRIEVSRTGDAQSAEASTRTFNFKDLTVSNGRIEKDGLLHHSPRDAGGTFWHGPYHHSPYGRYNVTFFLKAVPNEPGDNDTVIILDACCSEGRNIISNVRLKDGDLTRGDLMDGWMAINLDVSIELPDAVVEFRGREPSMGYDIYIGNILMEPEGK